MTPRSGDRGRDVIAVKHGFGSMRLIESMKWHMPGKKTTAEEVRASLAFFLAVPSEIRLDDVAVRAADLGQPPIAQYIPHRLELVDGKGLLKRFAEFTIPKTK